MTADQLKQPPIDTDALRQEFADYMVDVEPGIKARAPRLNQLETLLIVAMSLFAVAKELRAEKADQQVLITRLESMRDAQEVLIGEHIAKQREAEAAFKNFHRLLCERFDYVHDDKDWHRDQLSLIEWIATATQSAKTRTLTDAQIEDFQEAREILENMVRSIELDGNYSTEATCTFLRQALLCLPAAQLEPGAKS